MSAGRWTGGKSQKARKLLLARGRFQQCWRCGKPLDLTVDTWTAGHLLDRYLGGTDRPDNLAVECPSCNFRAGAKAGARITNKSTRPPDGTRIETQTPRW